MSDGHSGIESRVVNEGNAKDFKLKLSFLKQSDGRSTFVTHATSNRIYTDPSPLKFLELIGFEQYGGQCPINDQKCMYKIVGTADRNSYEILNQGQVQLIHDNFRRFSEKIDELFEIFQEEKKVLNIIRGDLKKQSIFGPPVIVSSGGEPVWIKESKFEKLRALEDEKEKVQQQINELSKFLPLLYGTGDVLRDAVKEALEFLGLEVVSTPPGYTVDLSAKTKDSSKYFGVEVTGISGAIKKNSNKLTQVVDFERIKTNGEKTILVANTHNNTPLTERDQLENFTIDAINFLSKFSVLLMTSRELYEMIDDAIKGQKTKEELIELLHTKNGELKLYRLTKE